MFDAPRQIRPVAVGAGDVGSWLCAARADRFRQDLSTLWRGKWTIVALGAAALALALVFIALAPRQYTAATQILIDPTDLLAVGNGATPSTPQSDAGLLQVESQVRVLGSDAVLRRVVNAARSRQGSRIRRRAIAAARAGRGSSRRHRHPQGHDLRRPNARGADRAQAPRRRSSATSALMSSRSMSRPAIRRNRRASPTPSPTPISPNRRKSGRMPRARFRNRCPAA